MLKTCINSIKSTSVSGDQQETSRSSQFLEELNALISSANSITKSLDEVDHGYKKHATLNGTRNKPQVKEESKELSTTQGDVDMTECSDSNNNNTDQLNADKNNKATTTKKSKASNCDFKDVILCNLIDDFLLKESEF